MFFCFSSRRRHTRCALVTWSSDVCSSDLIGFETSASDAIRLKWAYQLGLLELGHIYATNQPGVLLLDEPRQQSSSKVSFGKLLERASAHRHGNQQVIVSTSEDFETLAPILDRLECAKTIFKGYVIQPARRSEEHTSELQSLMRISYAVLCLKKKNTLNTTQQPVT